MVRISAGLPVAGRWASYLVLGGALVLPFGVLATFAAALAPDLGTTASMDVIVTLAVSVVGVLAFGLLHPVQQLELTAAHELLVTGPLPAAPRAGTARRRVALWFGVHVLAGLVGSCLLLGVMLGPVLLLQWVKAGQVGVIVLLAGLFASVLLGPAVALALARGLAGLAPRMLGPSAQERMTLLRSQAGELARRQRLAREVHDSVGHALSVVTLQAAAARHVFDRDPEFARSALAAVEETARTALTELDHVLGLLAENPVENPVESPATPARVPGTSPAGPTLSDLDDLLSRTRVTGVPVLAHLAGPLPLLPADLSREAYRIVQEAVTNAVKHGDGTSVSVRVEILDGTGPLAIDVTNRAADPHPDSPPRPTHLPTGAETSAGRTDFTRSGRPGGRGLIGLRRRVTALDGTMKCGPRDHDWILEVRLPLSSDDGPGTLGDERTSANGHREELP